MSSNDNKDIEKIAKKSKNFIENTFKDIMKLSATKQTIFGTASGWLTGYVGMKVAKIAAFAIGGGIIVLHVANQCGYIKINWNEFNENNEEKHDKTKEESLPNLSEKIKSFMIENTPFSMGFAGGVCLGLATS